MRTINLQTWVFVSFSVLLAGPSALAAGNQRLTVFVSDLHMGVGVEGRENTPCNNSDGLKWHRSEDFRWCREFKQFLDFIDDQSKGNTDLVLVGDILELWQSSKVSCEGEGTARKCKVLDCDYSDKNLGCTEAEAVSRARVVLRQHKALLKHLGSFASSGNNRITILPGNHDAALLYPKVAKATLEAIGTPSRKVVISEEGFWVSGDGFILASHGHEFDDINAFEGWPNPFVENGGVRYIRKPSGEGFVQHYYNQYEERFPIIDNLSSEWQGVRLGVESAGFDDTRDAVSKLLTFFATKVSWEQAKGWLGPEEEALKWDVAGVRALNDEEFVLGSFAADDPIRVLAANAKSAGISLPRPQDLTDEEIQIICDRRYLLSGQDRRTATCPKGRLGAVFTKVLNKEKAKMSRHLQEALKTIRAHKPYLKPFRLYVYGHTHKATPPEKLKIERGWEVTVTNDGAFQRVVRPEQLDEIQTAKCLKDGEALLHLTVHDLPACYTYVRVDSYTDTPQAQLKYWMQTSSGTWQESDNCNWKPTKTACN